MAERDEITIAVLAERLAGMESRMSAQFHSVNRRLDSMEFVHIDSYRLQIGAILDKVEALEEAKQWVARTFVAAFAFPVLVGIILALAMSR